MWLGWMMPLKKRQPKKPQSKSQKVIKVIGAESSLVPSSVSLKEALKGVRFGDEIMLAYHMDDIELECDYCTANGRKIPRLLVTIKKRATIEIYGSHLQTPEDHFITHVVHNPTNYYLIHIPEFGRAWPPHLFLIQSSRKGWVIATNARTNLNGESRKTVFQGVEVEEHLVKLLAAVREIKDCPVDYLETIKLPEGSRTKTRVGERLLDLLVPAIRNFDFKMIGLLEKCMRFLEFPTPTKLDRFIKPLRNACTELDRLPTAPELYARITAGGYQLNESRFYSDLRDVGLGWLTKKKPSK